MSAIRVLVVDDDEGFRVMTTDALELAGLKVETAADGAEAWERLRRERFDAVVVDLNMPVMDGLELTRRLRADAALKDIPVLMLTIKDLIADQLSGYERGADDYMTKPFDARMLAAKVRALVRRGPPGPATRS